jgi:hypothetical protein
MDTAQVKELETNLVSFIIMQKSFATANLREVESTSVEKEKLYDILERSLLMLQKPEAAGAGADLISHLLSNVSKVDKEEDDFFKHPKSRTRNLNSILRFFM